MSDEIVYCTLLGTAESWNLKVKSLESSLAAMREKCEVYEELLRQGLRRIDPNAQYAKPWIMNVESALRGEGESSSGK